MPLRNRVTPFGEIVAVPARGTLLGNRGVLHDDQQRIVRDSQVRRWIACRLEFRGRHRELLQSRRWTELFFLDEATALAAGHRPCAECRHADYLRWRAAWPVQGQSIDQIDAQLHVERRVGPWQKRTYLTELRTLPTGAFVAIDGTAYLVQEAGLARWSAAGYAAWRSRFERRLPRTVEVLTPPSLVEVLRNGYRPAVHPTAESAATDSSTGAP